MHSLPPSPLNNCLILSLVEGGLGNRITLFANFIAAAREYDFDILYPHFSPFSNYFRGTCGAGLAAFSCAEPQWKIPQVETLFLHFKSWMVENSPPEQAAIVATTIAPLTYEMFARPHFTEPIHLAFLRFVRILVESTRSLETPSATLGTVFLRGEQDLNLDSTSARAYLTRTPLTFCHGWLFRAPESLQKHAPFIREFFSLCSAEQQKIDTIVAPLKSEGTVVVGIHIRRGDYKVWQEGKYFFDFEQYAAVMRQLQNFFSDRRVRFLICSNEPVPSELFGEFEVTFGYGTTVLDLYSLAACDFIVGPPSTFTGWGSFYGQKKLHYIRSPGEPIVFV